MLLFVYSTSREIFGNAQEPFLFTVEKTNTGVYVRNNVFTSMEEMIDSFLWNQYKAFKANNVKQFNESNLGPVHQYPEIFVSSNFFMQIHLVSTRVRCIRSLYPEISVYALQSGNFCISCVSGYVWMFVSVYFCIRWRHSIRTCSLILWDVRIRIGYVWTGVYDSYTLRLDEDNFVST